MKYLMFWISISILLRSAADVPGLLPFHGRLTDAAGKPVPDGERVIQFQIFGEPTGGAPLWAGEIHRTRVNGGFVNVVLGRKNPFPKDRPDDPNRSFFDGTFYLQVNVDVTGPDGKPDGEITELDPPLLPRQPLLPVVFARDSGNARKLQGYDWSSIFGTNDPLGGIDGSKITPGTIASNRLAPDAAISVGVGILGPDSALLSSQPLNPELQRQGYAREISPLMAGTVPYFIYRKQSPEFLRLIPARADGAEMVSGRSTKVAFDLITNGIAQTVLTLRNLGNGALNGLGVTVIGSDGTTFTVSVASPSVAAGDTTAVTLVFKPLTVELKATLHVQAAGISELFDLSTVARINMELIPAGSFQMGDTFGDGVGVELPVHSVYVSAFYMDKYEVTKALWDEVMGWGGGNGYDSYYYSGYGKAANHPVQTVDWFSVVKWCNARSEKEGRVPAYYSDAALTQVYKTGEVVPYVKWDAGYRLPTEAEWEKAERGGADGLRFPWSDADTITHSRANYRSDSVYAYDVSPTRDWNPTYAVGSVPFTSPVGSFAANGYGLYDMAGNVLEWCWDWFGSYSSGPQTDPHGPASGSVRVVRGGNWRLNAWYCRSAYRSSLKPDYGDFSFGFRSVLPPGSAMSRTENGERSSPEQARDDRSRTAERLRSGWM